MRYLQFNIINYRAIENATLEIDHHRLIPIIGINESGKTTMLYAILAFHSSKDEFAPEADPKNLKGESEGIHLNFENNYYIGKQPKTCYIKAQILLEKKEEIDAIVKTLGVLQGVDLERVLLEYLDKKTAITLCRELKLNSDNEIEVKYLVENFLSQMKRMKNLQMNYLNTHHIFYILRLLKTKLMTLLNCRKHILTGKM